MTLIITPPKNKPRNIKVNIVPKDPCIEQGGTIQFNATVEGTTYTDVTWLPISGEGSINQSGLYIAPVTGAPTTATIRAVSKADPLKYDDAVITIKALAADCCKPLIDIKPDTVVLPKGNSYQFNLYLDGQFTYPASGVTWSVVSGNGSVSTEGLFTLPSSAETFEKSIIMAASGLTCYDLSTVIVGENIDIDVQPKTKTIYVGQSTDFSAEVVGSSNQLVTWSLREFLPNTAVEFSISPAGYTELDGTVTAPTAVPVDTPYVRVRATSIIDDGVWDEAVCKVVSNDLPLKWYKFTKYNRREPKFVQDNAGKFGLVQQTETVYQESDPYHGEPTIPISEFVRPSDYGTLDRQVPYVNPIISKVDGYTPSNFIPMISYDSISVPELPPSNGGQQFFDELHPGADLSWSRSYKVPQWEKVFFVIDSTDTFTNLGFEFTQHDFSSLGSTIEVVSGAVSEYDNLLPVNQSWPSNTSFNSSAVFAGGKVGFVYYTTTGFFSGTQGQLFNPSATARDVIKLTGELNGIPFQRYVYLRPEPDLPEVFPDVVNPQIAGNRGIYLPSEYPKGFTTNFDGKPISYVITNANYLTDEEYANAHGCSIECGVSWSGSGGEYPQVTFVNLPYTQQNVPTDGTIPAALTPAADCMMPPIASYFGHVYHGNWFAAMPAVFAPRNTYAVVQSERVQSNPETGSGVVGLHSRTPQSVSTPTATTERQALPSYEIRLTALKNRHYMSYLPDLTPRTTYPVDVKFEILTGSDSVRVDAPPTDVDRNPTLYGGNCEITSSLGRYTIFRSKTISNTGVAKMAYVKATPNIFDGTFTRSTYIPVFLYGFITESQLQSVHEDDCVSNAMFKNRGYHLHSNNFAFDMWFADKTAIFNDDYSCHDGQDVVTDTNYVSTLQGANGGGCPSDRFVRIHRYLSSGLSPYRMLSSPIGMTDTNLFGESRPFFITVWSGRLGSRETAGTGTVGNRTTTTTNRTIGISN